MPNGTHLRGPYAKRAHTAYSVGSQYVAEPFVAEAGETSAQCSCTPGPSASSDEIPEDRINSSC